MPIITCLDSKIKRSIRRYLSKRDKERLDQIQPCAFGQIGLKGAMNGKRKKSSRGAR